MSLLKFLRNRRRRRQVTEPIADQNRNEGEPPVERLSPLVLWALLMSRS